MTRRRGFSTLGTVVGQTPRTKHDQKSDHLKGNKVTMGNNVPRQTEGAVGDITVRKIPIVGLRAYIKTDSGWYDINAMIAGNKINWIDMNLDNSWVRYGTNSQIPQYCKDSNGFVHFRGVMKDGSGATASFTTLPEGFRPPRAVIMPAHKAGTGAHVGVSVSSLGVCAFTAGTTDSQEYIDGVTFFAQQRQTSVATGQPGESSDIGQGLVS